MIKIKNTRIGIIGAGAAGLITAFYLKRHGYRNVMVLEKAPRVGGICRTVTHEYCSFDMGANYITPYYKEVRKIARKIGAKLIKGPPNRAYNVKTGKLHRLLWLVRGEGILNLAIASIRYLFLLFRYRNIISPPGFKDIHLHPELCESFSKWLDRHKLNPIKNIFIPPVTIFGYGSLDEIPAAYVLKYMNARDFAVALTMGLGFERWPKRFKEGYQRFLERLSWGLHVHTEVVISKVTRGDVVRMETSMGSLEFDALIVACPLDQTLGFMDWSPEVRELISKIRYSDYCVTAWTRKEVPHATLLEFPFRPPGDPWGISKMFPHTDLCLFYTQLPAEMKNCPNAEVEAYVTRRIAERVEEQLKKEHKMAGPLYNSPYLFMRHAKYFPHVNGEEMAQGFYEKLEALQGANHTWLTGGLHSFELVETIARFSKKLVNTYFPKA